MISAKEARECVLSALDSKKLDRQLSWENSSKLGNDYVKIYWNISSDHHPQLLNQICKELVEAGYVVERDNWVSGIGGNINIDWSED
jgi:hypothetical protein